MPRNLALWLIAALVITLMPRAVSAADRWDVSLRVRYEYYAVGKKPVVVFGDVAPRAAGQQVVLQKRFTDGRRWKTEQTTRVDRRGRYIFTDRPTSLRDRWYRVVKPAGHGHSRGISEKKLITIYRWSSLTRLLDPSAASNASETSVTIDGTTVPRSVSSARGASGPGFLEYRLDGRCREIKGYFGSADGQDPAEGTLIRLLTDGQHLTEWSDRYPEPAHKKLYFRPYTSVLRIEFDHWVELQEVIQPAIGNPRILCIA